MKNRVSIAVSVTALIVALLAATGTAGAVISFAANAGKLNGFKASKVKKKNTVVVRGRNGLIDRASIPPQARGARGATGATGPVGPQGAQGAQGAQGPPGTNGTNGANGTDGARGPVGPTFGAGNTTGNAPVVPITGFRGTPLNINLPAGGNLLVVGRVRSFLSCSSTPCAANYSLYIDGAAIPTSNAAQVGASAADNLTTFAIAQNVAAGPHEIKMALTGTGGWSTIGHSDIHLTAVLLGGGSATAASSPASAGGTSTTRNE
jgi:hypothetical protein